MSQFHHNSPLSSRFCGAVRAYDRKWNRMNSKGAVSLRSFPDVEYFPTTASQDPEIQALAKKGEGNVYTTDSEFWGFKFNLITIYLIYI